MVISSLARVTYTAYYNSSRGVFNSIDYGRGEKIVGKQFNSFEGLESSPLASP